MESFVSFALVVGLAAAEALALMLLSARRLGSRKRTALVCFALALPLGVLGGRAAFWLCSLDWIGEAGESFWDLLSGEYHYMLYGAFAGGALAAVLAALLTRASVPASLDAAAAPAALTLAFGRFGEYLIDAGVGANVAEWFDHSVDPEEWVSMIGWEDPSPICRFPFAVKNFYGSWRFSVNLWEGLAALAFLIVLLCMRRRRKGGAASLFLLLYAACQILFESMRRDQVMTWSFVKINQLLSGIVIAGILLLCWFLLPRGERRPSELALRGGGLLAAVGIVILMEFALDLKIGFLRWMRADLCYLVMGICCLAMLLDVLPLWKRTLGKAEQA